MGSYLELVYNSCASGSQEPLFLCSNPEAAAAADDSMRFVTAPKSSVPDVGGHFAVQLRVAGKLEKRKKKGK